MATHEQYKARRVLGEWEHIYGEVDAMASSNITINGSTGYSGGYVQITPEAVSRIASAANTTYKKEETMATVNLDDLFEVFPEIKPKFRKSQKTEAYAQFVADVTNVAKQHRDNKAYDRISKIKGSK